MEATKDYIKGFNNGYLFSRYANELADTVIDRLEETEDYLQGLKDGKLQYEQELDKELSRWANQHKDMQDQSREPEPDKSPDQEKDKGLDYDMD
ncbi:MAG: hypothetical protein AAF731_04865 [Bacteroidota bacterium]